MVEFKAERQGITGLFTLPYAEGARGTERLR